MKKKRKCKLEKIFMIKKEKLHSKKKGIIKHKFIKIIRNQQKLIKIVRLIERKKQFT